MIKMPQIVNQYSKSALSLVGFQELSLDNYIALHRLTKQACEEILSIIQPGWTEPYCERLLNAFLKDSDRAKFFKTTKVQFGENTRLGLSKKQYNKYRIYSFDDQIIFNVYPEINSVRNKYSMTQNKSIKNPQINKDLNSFKDLILTYFNEWMKVETNSRKSSFRFVENKIIAHFKFKNYLNNHTIKAKHIQLSNGQGLWQIKLHVSNEVVGARFEDLLLVDGVDCSWLDSVV